MTTTSTFDQQALVALPPAPAFIDAMRRTAFERFTAMPIPSPSTEEWRYTDLSEFDLGFVPHVPGHGRGVPEQSGNLGGSMVQHNSSAAMTTSDQDIDRHGVIFCDLDLAAEKHPDLVEQHLHSLVPTDRTTFTALHGAFRTGGTFLYVPADVSVELPLQTLSYLDADGAAVFPHTLIIAERGAEITFIDRFASPDLQRGFSDAITEIVVGDGAHVRYVAIQEWGQGMTHLGVVRARVGRDASIRTLSIGFGADLSRVENEVLLAESGGFSEQLGVFFADGDQHFDHRSIQDHVAPNCTSDLLYKGALRDHSRAVYSGWVHVRPDAQKTNAMQTSRNIVLSEHAKADAIPNLEIEANDVRCGHAASVGPVDDDTVFYLTSRGIPREEAERLIVTGFFQEVLDRVQIEQVRTNAELAIQEELERGIR
ncbi:MAG: Fe-S cluster assembly protein SufD [Actinomycetota bacterium]|jgi:Fe-S cluster assembly protein SufD|nr:Fe-S cluster assembly protein SufD [Actinomycetota bacterium]